MSWQPFLTVIPGFVPADLAIKHVTYEDVSDTWPMKDQVCDQIDEINQQLVDDPTLEAPEVSINDLGRRQMVCKNELSLLAFHSRPALEEWRCELVPSALSLWAIQYPLAERLISGAMMDGNSRLWFIHANDARGVRSRAKVMGDIASALLKQNQNGNWISLACGAAVPVLRTIHSGQCQSQSLTLRLIDFDKNSLNFARGLASKYGLREGRHFHVLQRNLIKRMILSDKLVKELGEQSAELVDALGIFEYFIASDAVNFLRHAVRLVKPGGVLIISNMLSSSPQMAFVLRCIGWSDIHPRSLKELRDILVEAGIDLRDVTVTLPDDGVYAVMEIKVR